MRSTLAALVLAALIAAAQAPAQIALNDKEYFEGPGIKFLQFHNNYMGGFQGGLQLVQNGERILDTGTILLRLKPGAAPARPAIARREVNKAAGTSTVFGDIPEWGSGYSITTRTDGRRLIVLLKLDKPLDWSIVDSAGFTISLFPTTFFSKSYQGETGSGVFPRQYSGHTILLDKAKTIRVAQEDPLHAFAITHSGSALRLVDTRDRNVQGWFAIHALMAPGSSDTQIEVAITPTVNPVWRRPPVIGISQVGYHPRQPKRAVIELDAREKAAGAVTLYKMTLDGGRKAVKQGAMRDWGVFHSYRYGVFDFSEINEPGVYQIEYAGQKAGPFRISPEIFTASWQPTMQVFVPTQMCHVLVREGNRIWHGACHLDDAHQAPANTTFIDGYSQLERETKYKDNEHIGGLAWGGWHDAGDHDVPAGSLCGTIEGLALAREEFKASMDTTSVHRNRREVELFVPDGKDDILQQIAYGAEWLLAAYKAVGHVPPGVIERTGFMYGTKGDMAGGTDNRVYDPSLQAYEIKNERSGTLDDRWLFTNRNTGLQFRTVHTLTLASRVLKDDEPALAAECLAAAEKLWNEERGRTPAWGPGAYTPRDSGFRDLEASATAELLLTTGKQDYRAHLLTLAPILSKMTPAAFAAGPGMTLVRARASIADPAFLSMLDNQIKAWKPIADRRIASSPYGVLYDEDVTDPGYKLESRSHVHSGFVWGHGWRLQSAAMRHYFFHKQYPSMFSPDPVLNTVNYVLGCHPATNESLVSGVGAHSNLAAYGFNRADWSYQAGGIISGTSLIKPDLLELKNPFPFLWYQTEIVINAAGSWVFDVLAAERLASAK